MAWFKVYAGLGGGFGGAQYHGTYEFRSQDDAEREAYMRAWEEYESYGGHHGLDDPDTVLEDLRDSGIIGDDMDECAIEQAVNEAYLELVEGWIDYYVKPATGPDDIEED